MKNQHDENCSTEARKSKTEALSIAGIDIRRANEAEKLAAILTRHISREWERLAVAHLFL